MQSTKTILVIDDEPEIRRLLSEILEDEGYRLVTAENAEQASEQRARVRPDLILLDIWMPDCDGITLLKSWQTETPELCPIVMMSGHGSVESAVEATRLGAFDYLEKPLSMARLLMIVERALASASLDTNPVSDQPQEEVWIDFEPIGKSAAISRVKEQLKRLANHDARVLFTGEAGVGKELFARYLHAHSPRREHPFVSLAVGSLAPENAAVEFFGKEAQGRVYPGLLEQAHGGTLFLSEIASMDMESQLRLLSALESRAFLRVGGSVSVRVDVRVLASSRQPLEEAVRAGRLRRDLYFLLNEVAMVIPPLRDHAEDVPALLGFYVDWFVTREKLPFRRFTMLTQNFLRNYPWPGNVRELKNLVQRLMILGVGDEIELDEVKSAMGSGLWRDDTQVPEFYHLPLKEAREQFEKAYLEYHFDKSGGSVAKLAALVGVERTHLYRKLHALNIKL
ncbi:MAG: sigma-54 dependent transcriptional regulator [Methylococcales bacterium]|nr:sigma-54 dependent transcriptional regulator [Methylococcales bacterium]